MKDGIEKYVRVTPLDYAEVYKNIVNGIKSYCEKYHIKALVLGISGGIDSTVCAALCKQVDLPLIYKGKDTGKQFRIDMLVDDMFIVELKAVELFKPLHDVQLVTYLRLADIHMGLLINFNVPVLKKGIRRKINGRFENTGITFIENW